MKHDGWVSGARFDRADGRILSWSRDGTVRVWDAASGQPRGAPMKHDGEVIGALFDTAEGRPGHGCVAAATPNWSFPAGRQSRRRTFCRAGHSTRC